jgi:starvation-inducible DNA-binding protein
MYATPSRLPENARTAIADALNARLAEGLDLQAQVKHAHWNVKGPHFAPLHALFDGIATAVTGFNDEIAERAVTLGARAQGTLRMAAKASRLPDLPGDVVQGLDLAKLVAERVEAWTDGLREARKVAQSQGDEDTFDLLTGVVEEMEKQGWFLRATLER